jgi:hypothetical protein
MLEILLVLLILLTIGFTLEKCNHDEDHNVCILCGGYEEFHA